ncbi:hypothetical protein D031_1479A, partial [Vibrio parahaemolyticus VP-48]
MPDQRKFINASSATGS